MKIAEIEKEELKYQLTDNVRDALKYNSQDIGTDKISEIMGLFIDALKTRYKEVDINDVKKAILNGTYGDYGKYNWINTKVLIDWVRQKWMSILDKSRRVDEIEEIHKFDVEKYPVGKAIIWKMNHISLDDWEMIPIKKIAEAIKNRENMSKFAESYGIELISRN